MDPTAGRKWGGQHRGIPPRLLFAGYVLPMCWLCAPMNNSEFMGAYSQYSRGNQGEFRRYAGAASLPTIRVCIYEAEH